MKVSSLAVLIQWEEKSMREKEETFSYAGQCLCGKIKYTVNKIEKNMAHCHCNMCRKFHGSAFSTYAEAKSENFNWVEGQEYLQSYIAANGTKRKFCKNCGSGLIFVSSSNTGEFVEFALGTLDSKIEVKPDAHIFVKSAVNWYEINDKLPQFEGDRIIKP